MVKGCTFLLYKNVHSCHTKVYILITSDYQLVMLLFFLINLYFVKIQICLYDVFRSIFSAINTVT